MAKRIFALILASLMLVALAACGEKKDPDYLYVGTDDTYPPMEFLGDDGKPQGFDIDVANAVALKMGKKGAKFVSSDWNGIFLSLDKGTYDCIFSSVSITDERKEKYELSDPYVSNKIVIVTGPDSGIASPDDLNDKKVAVQAGTTADDFVIDLVDKGLAPADFNQYDQIMQCFEELSLGRVDAVVVDVVVAYYYTGKDSDKFKIAWETESPEPIGVCIKKGNTELLAQVNSALAALKEDGTLASLSEKWFYKDITAMG